MSVPYGARPLRVVVLSHVAQLSGAELALTRLLPALRDVQAHVILAEDGPLVRRLRRANVSVEVLPMGEAARGFRRELVRLPRLGPAAPFDTLTYTVRLAARLRRLRPDLVHASSLKALVYGSLAARLTGIPLLWHAHDRIAADYLPPPAVHLVRGFARLATTVVANSRSTLETVGTAASRAVVIPYPVVASSASRHPERGLAGRPVRVGMVGRISPWKGQHVFLEAFAHAFREGDSRAVIVGASLFGEADYEADLRALCRQLELDGRVEFRGFQEDIADELAQLDVLVHASTIPEPFGQVVVEGMNAGLPVVAAAAGGPAEIVRDGTTGFLYPPGDVVALANTLGRLAGDPELRRRVGAAARESTDRFAPELVAAQMAAAYRRTVSITGRQA
jgi:glycosyltransferase involved in cell wall biosynthesis